ncbi:MAG: hypothetical protein NT139_03395 [Candidatus Woesearchaeota archaeon]|nr:hypothetical protein [Candidatus Woesearchaeota archaeon]
MQKRLFFVIVGLLLFSIGVSAIEVGLLEPSDNTVNTTSNKIIFKCVGAGETLSTLTLIFNTGYAWYPIETKSANNFEAVNFIYEIPANGVYKWNCMAKNTQNQVFYAISNYTLTISKTNSPPVYPNPRTANTYIQNITWNKNEAKTNVCSLDYYFYDPENDLLTYSTSGNLNIQVNIDSITHLVSFSQPSNWFGIEKVTFIASDGKSSTSSNQITLTVVDTGSSQQQNQSSTNQRPQFTDVIPNQTKYKNGGSWNLDLGDYATDDKDSKDQLTWSISNVDTSLLEAVVNNDNKRINFTPKKDKVGNDTITITVKDTGNLSASQQVSIFILDDTTSGSSSNQSNSSEEIIKEENFPPDINNILPDNTKNLTLSEEQVFRVSASDQDNDKINYRWYLDDSELKDQIMNTYVLDPTTLSNGAHTLKISVNDGKSTISKTWNLEYSPNNASSQTKTIENKTFLASTGSQITGKTTAFKDRITGSFVNVKDFVVKWKTPFIVGGSIIALLIIFILVRIIVRKRSNDFMPKIKSNGIYTPKKFEDKTTIIPLKDEPKNGFKRI